MKVPVATLVVIPAIVPVETLAVIPVTTPEASRAELPVATIQMKVPVASLVVIPVVTPEVTLAVIPEATRAVMPAVVPVPGVPVPGAPGRTVRMKALAAVMVAVRKGSQSAISHPAIPQTRTRLQLAHQPSDRTFDIMETRSAHVRFRHHHLLRHLHPPVRDPVRGQFRRL